MAVVAASKWLLAKFEYKQQEAPNLNANLSFSPPLPPLPPPSSPSPPQSSATSAGEPQRELNSPELNFWLTREGRRDPKQRREPKKNKSKSRQQHLLLPEWCEMNPGGAVNFFVIEQTQSGSNSIGKLLCHLIKFCQGECALDIPKGD